MRVRRAHPGYDAGPTRRVLPYLGATVLLALLCAVTCRSKQEQHSGGATAVTASQPSSTAASTLPSASVSVGTAAPATPPARPVRIAFAGDVNMSMLVGQYVARRAKGLSVPEGVEDAFPFTAVRDRLRAADIAVANLECVVSLQGKRATEHNPFRAPVESISILRDAGFDMLSVANNHTRDFGPAGLRGTRRNLIEGGIAPLGTFGADLQEPVVREVRGVRVAFLAYYNIYKSTTKGAYRDVKYARSKADAVVVFNHWGSEKHPEVQPMQQSFGQGLVDAGADVVVGTHVHVLQPEEWYREGLIVYGLGNFVFNGMNFDEAHRTGGYLEVDVDRSGIRARRFYRIRLDQYGAPRWLDTAPRDPERLPSSADNGATKSAPTRIAAEGALRQ